MRRYILSQAVIISGFGFLAGCWDAIPIEELNVAVTNYDLAGAPPCNGKLNDVWGSGDTGWIVADGCGSGPSGMLVRKLDRNMLWTASTIAASQNVALGSIWGSSDSQIWAVGKDVPMYPGSGRIVSYDGSSWSETPLTGIAGLNRVHGFDKNHVWAVGNQGTILTNESNSWQPPNLPEISSLSSYDFNGVWVKNLNEVWLAGSEKNTDSGVIIQLVKSPSSTVWSLTSPVRQIKDFILPKIAAIWGNASSVWAVGDKGFYFKWDGVMWRKQNIPGVDYFTGIKGVDGEDGLPWLIGYPKYLIHLKNDSWSQKDIGQDLGTPTGFWPRKEGDVWVTHFAADKIMGINLSYVTPR